MSGFVTVRVESYSTTLWKVTTTSYRLAPADSSSDRNNVEHKLFGGTAWAGLDSTSSAKRDNVSHALFVENQSRPETMFAKKNGTAYVTSKMIFDKFGSDPRCTARVTL